ncbi:MAG: FHA domain-containing protein [Bifidobacteriaceae bacterium]|jgi:pSer/pThr/pTyr-binding forkhead associated (FHA) protein|nr:FHA domain-containing protein [Bifidobacteriaceae bacterium]
MGELSVSLLRLGYLLILWVFVAAALLTLRRDIYGTTIRRRDAAPRGRARARRLERVGRPAELAGGPLAAAQAFPVAAAPAPPAPRAGAPTKLIVKSGHLRGTILPLTRSPVVIGRSSTANLVLDDEFASGRHAQLVPRGGGWVLEDLGSTNGTFVGRERIAGPTELTAGQSIRIGNTTLEVLR